MDTATVVSHVQHVAAVRADVTADRDRVTEALKSLGRLQSWLAASKAALTSQLAPHDPFPERTIAECTRGSNRDAAKDAERAATLAAAPCLAGALDRADVTSGHVDEVTRAGRQLDGDQRRDLLDRVEQDLLDVAAGTTVEEWRTRLAFEVKSIQRDAGMERLERQRRASRMRTWTDGEGMWCFSGKIDPVSALPVAARLDATVTAMFAQSTPGTCPSDPVEKQHHLRALAFTALVSGTSPGTRSGRPEFVVVVDTSRSDGDGSPVVDWGLPVEIPARVVAQLGPEAVIHPVIVRNGVVLHAPGVLDLGRSTRLASPAQRRALRAMYPTCAIPGCEVRFDRCKIHHVIWWRNGGRTDLDNLVPVCSHHHSRIHSGECDIGLGPNRELTVRFPDGTVHNTGPPSRRAA